MGSVNIIDEKVEEYKKSKSDTIRRRNEWNEKIKETIYNTLNTIANEYDLDWEVQKNESIQNSHSVQLIFGNTPSGIVEEGIIINKIGGYLNYAQTINGKIAVSVIYPYLEKKFTSEMSPDDIGVFEPSEITDTLIYTHIAEFLSKITCWESA